MRVSVFGLGYVGAVSAACLSDQGHDVVGVDVNPQKVEEVRQGHPPVIEPKLAETLAAAVRMRRLRATVDAGEAVVGSDVSLICVEHQVTGTEVSTSDMSRAYARRSARPFERRRRLMSSQSGALSSPGRRRMSSFQLLKPHPESN